MSPSSRFENHIENLNSGAKNEELMRLYPDAFFKLNVTYLTVRVHAPVPATFRHADAPLQKYS